MSELTDAAIDAALERGRITRLHEPRAAAARYDRAAERVVVELTNGCTFAFPPQLAQELENATADQLAQVEILGAGYGLHWEALDVDLAVPDLLTGLLGTKSYMARRAGRTGSPAKAAAARANGAKGGRPRKSA
jgi:predicted TPR repeat methyltransferase